MAAAAVAESPRPIAETPEAPAEEPRWVDPNDYAPGDWYVLQVRAGREESALRHLKALAQQPEYAGLLLDAASPTQEDLPPRGSAGKAKKVRLYPGYLLVKTTLDDLAQQAIRRTPGILGFVGGDFHNPGAEEPTPLTPAEAAAMTGLQSPAPARYAAPYSVGDQVELVSGPFAQLTATVEALDDKKGRVKVKILAFGREVPTELDLDAVAPIKPAK